MNTLRIATWNLEYTSINGGRFDAVRKKMQDVKADIWVLTETMRDFAPGDEYELVAETQRSETDHPDDIKKRWSMIWAKAPVRYKAWTPMSDPKRAACAWIELAGGAGLYVYGTVLPWHSDRWEGREAKGGEAFFQALEAQREDWQAIRGKHHDAWLCVAGDFNQDLIEGKSIYQTEPKRDALASALKTTDLECLTGWKKDPVARLYPEKANIDHICLAGLSEEHLTAAHASAWSLEYNGKMKPDHFGVMVELPLP